jgi:hypothetical protein
MACEHTRPPEDGATAASRADGAPVIASGNHTGRRLHSVQQVAPPRLVMLSARPDPTRPDPTRPDDRDAESVRSTHETRRTE